MTFLEAWNELLSHVPKLPIPLAQKLTQRAWRDIRDSRTWSFLRLETTIDVPLQITAGTVTVSQGSTLVQGDTTAAAAWTAIANADFITRQFRSGSGPIYQITAYADPTITLDRPYMETSSSTATYSVYKCYYPEPANFLRWVSVVDPVDGYQLAVNRTKPELDRRDPIRGAFGQPYVISSFKWDTSTTPGRHLFELYPHPIAQRSYPALYESRGVDLTAVPPQSIPVIIPDEVLMERSKYYAYEWAMANVPEGKNWVYLMSQCLSRYSILLEKAKRQDEEIFMQNQLEGYLFDPYRRLSWDGNYAQSHAPWVSAGTWL